uniref:Tetraspanin n=1 Tax=Panagrolaimus sp. JU765 TaxID=591449 RepID=A0AC34QKI3_9BILA
MVYYRGSRCARTCMLIYTVLFWISGFVLFFIGLWMILDPRRSYILDLVDFSEDDPLLRFAAYTCIVVGSITSFLIFVFFIFCAEIAIGLLGIFYREKFTGDRMEVYIANMSHNRYYRDKWVTPLMDTIQYYQQCCGGKGPWDYYNSFWYITNTERGTRSYVPSSCCRQTQNARAWSLQPIDPLCPIYYYDTQAHNTSVNTKGCHERLQNWFEENSWIFIILGSSCAALQVVGMFIAMVLIRQISSYQYLY